MFHARIRVSHSMAQELSLFQPLIFSTQCLVLKMFAYFLINQFAYIHIVYRTSWNVTVTTVTDWYWMVLFLFINWKLSSKLNTTNSFFKTSKVPGLLLNLIYYWNNVFLTSEKKAVIYLCIRKRSINYITFFIISLFCSCLWCSYLLRFQGPLNMLCRMHFKDKRLSDIFKGQLGLLDTV